MQMTNDEFEAALKQYPCPDCGEVGHLMTQHLVFKVEHKGQLIEVEGRGWTCEGGCGHVFMSDELTEQMANRIHQIENGHQRTCYKLDRASGEFNEHALH